MLDIDVKDNGVNEFNKYIQAHGDINTYKVRTPSGGVHYYFTCKSSISVASGKIEYFKTASKYRDSGLDIRTNIGLIITAGSTTPKGSYTVMNNVDIVEMPLELIEWLLDPAACDKSFNEGKEGTAKTCSKRLYLLQFN